jgi:hypothetical protein
MNNSKLSQRMYEDLRAINYDIKRFREGFFKKKEKHLLMMKNFT